MSLEFKNLNIIGLMSGTSLDGINASFVSTNGYQLQRYNINHMTKYKKETYNLLQKTIKEKSFEKNLDELNYLVTIDHLGCLKKILKLISLNVDMIGFHGQTIFHSPKQKSIQLGNPQLLADMTSIDVAFNFRNNDIINGGQGAPIAPIYHKLIVEQLMFDLPSCVVNIGGISNISFIDKNTLIGFDTGTGNCLLDKYMQEKLDLPYDNKGLLGLEGISNQEFINFVLKDNFFKKKYPKSLDKLAFDKYYEILIKKNYSHKDNMSTLSYITAESIIKGIETLPKLPKKVLIIGGGMHNRAIIKLLKQKYPEKIITGNEVNVNGEMIEAELMGFLAARSLYNLPITFPLTTGVKKGISGGKIYHPKQ